MNMRAQPPVKCHCGKMARYYDPVGAWRCVECRCTINSHGKVRIARCDTGMDEIESQSPSLRHYPLTQPEF